MLGMTEPFIVIPSAALVILSGSLVILNASLVILSASLVILSAVEGSLISELRSSRPKVHPDCRLGHHNV